MNKVLVVLLLFGLLGLGNGLRCYECDTTKDEVCKDKFRSFEASQFIRACPSDSECVKFKFAVLGEHGVVRGCMTKSMGYCSKMVNTKTFIGEISCESCETDLCNNGHVIFGSTFLTFLGLIILRNF